MFSLKDIIKSLSVIEFRVTDDSTLVTNVSSFENKYLSLKDIVWISDKNFDSATSLVNTNVLCSKKIENLIDSSCNVLIVDNPRLAFKKVLELFSASSNIDHCISSSAVLGSDVMIEEPVYIGHNCIIEDGCKISKNTYIGNNNVILKNTIIGENVVIGHNNTIGGLGFGYEKNEAGQFEFIPHIGGVILCNGVEIGSNTCIDRAVIGNTVIGENVKIDNLVHIAHGVDIGRNSLIIANSMIAGSVKIGENVWVSPSASIINKVKVEDNSLVGIGAVVLKNVAEDSVVVGNPAKKLIKS
jgi:UDP-3-O-[3-hydroxymyristoyl] glucosamine N-acyltransferase